mmetsp:Transcript_4951/g.19805  ORF Transcript_4951/g.19805 Transcript_4951/m.19805 type:complete len:374 (-) Transcript_4951:1663-2784(-)
MHRLQTCKCEDGPFLVSVQQRQDPVLRAVHIHKSPQHDRSPHRPFRLGRVDGRADDDGIANNRCRPEPPLLLLLAEILVLFDHFEERVDLNFFPVLLTRFGRFSSASSGRIRAFAGSNRRELTKAGGHNAPSDTEAHENHWPVTVRAGHQGFCQNLPSLVCFLHRDDPGFVQGREEAQNLYGPGDSGEEGIQHGVLERVRDALGDPFADERLKALSQRMQQSRFPNQRELISIVRDLLPPPPYGRRRLRHFAGDGLGILRQIPDFLFCYGLIRGHATSGGRLRAGPTFTSRRPFDVNLPHLLLQCPLQLLRHLRRLRRRHGCALACISSLSCRLALVGGSFHFVRYLLKSFFNFLIVKNFGLTTVGRFGQPRD